MRQCHPGYTNETEFAYLYHTRPDAFFEQRNCATASSLGLHATPYRTVSASDRSGYMVWAPDGTRFSGWRAHFQGGQGSAPGVVNWARACFDGWCNEHWADLFFGYEDWTAPAPKEWAGMGAVALQVQMLCTGWSGPTCAFGKHAPGLMMYAPEVRVDDLHPPSAPAVTGGSLRTGAWQRGVRTLDVAAADRGGGVSETSVAIGGVVRGARRPACPGGPAYGPEGPAWTRMQPCPTSDAGAISVDLREVVDGTHSVRAATADAAGQSAGAVPFTVKVDNTPPGSPSSAIVEGGDGWRRSNRFDVRWDNPVERHAPVAAARWRLCPVGGGECSSGRTAARDVSRLEALGVTRPGEHNLSIWLEDEAGNEDSERARHLRLRLDADAPSLSFARQDLDDPLRILVDAHDSQPGVADGEIFVRRQGGAAWHPLATTVEGSRLVATMDDERFGDGSYELRAHAVDRAGNEASTDRRGDGARMALRLPLRVATRMRVGFRRAARVRGRRVTKLVSARRVPLGRRARIDGTLSNREGNPIDDAPIQVYSRVQGSGADFRLVAVMRTDRRGRFAYSAKATRSRALRFRYPGSRRVRSLTRDVRLDVPALSSIRASDRSLVVGDAVTFSGTLRTGPVPAAGKLMEVQAFFRSRWRTFSTVRTDRRGRWRFGYRFGGTTGVVRYRFRVRVPPETDYPYAAGGSRTAIVTVRGP